jgi:DNA-binding response OmpR family regulator
MHTPPLILLIDDSVDFLEIIATRLKAASFQIRTATDALSGADIARSVKPDLILLDVNMPGVNGTEAFLDFKKDLALMDIKVAFLSDMPMPWPGISDREKFTKEIGGAAFLDKSENLGTLVEKIKSILGN